MTFLCKIVNSLFIYEQQDAKEIVAFLKNTFLYTIDYITWLL